MRWILASMLVFLFAACETTGGTWLGADIHLVDGTWISTETDCIEAATTCQLIVDEALEALPPDVRSTVVTAVLADLPTAYVTAGGEPRTAYLTAGIMSRKAIVVDLIDGSRKVIGLWCYLPSTSDASAMAADSHCTIVPLDVWRDGHAPPSLPPGTKVG
jgi:hypothetical protein